MQEIVNDKLSFIQKMIDTGDYDVAVKESSTVFELVFRQIFQQAMVSLPYREREQILEIERKIGKGQKGAQDFGFGELVGLFRESSLMEKWSKYTGKDLGLIKSLDYSSIVNLRNRITHQGDSCSRGEANIVYEYLRNLLAVLGFANLEDSINNSFKQNQVDQVQEISQPHFKERLPKIKKTSGKSIYSSNYGNEQTRLKVQAHIFQEFDLQAFSKALEQMDSSSELIGLDVGCASGYLTTDRFGAFDCFKHTIGIDINHAKISEAKENYQNEKFSFYELDIEDADFEERMTKVLHEHGKEKFDFIFSAFTLHHLANPLKALNKLRKLLKKGGCIILRGSDDGTKVAYPDEQNLVSSLIKLTQEFQGSSDRENGRKLYSQMWKTGFRDIEIMYKMNDTANKPLEAREALFQQSFSYRKNYFKKRLGEQSTNPQYVEEYHWVKEALEELELMFVNDSFYYMEVATIAVGRK